MKKLIKKALRYLFIPFVLRDYFAFKKAGDGKRFSVKLSDFYPQIKDRTIKTGFDRHYVYHTAWAARKVAEIKPAFHIDISSSLFFSGLVSAFIPVKFYDYRPAELSLSNLKSEHGDLMALPFENDSVQSLSCMHTIEHVGLGRYGDPYDQEGDLKAINELKRVLAIDGNLLFVVPVGKPKIEFNAHRIYSLEQILDYFKGLELKEFTLIPEKQGAPIIGATADQVAAEDYGCGCFWFVKKSI